MQQATQLTRSPDVREHFTPIAPLLWLAGLIFLCYAPVLQHLFHDWQANDDMGHGMFVPVVAGYIIWSRRNQLLGIRPRPNAWGLLLMALASAQLCVASLAGELFLARTAILLSLVGIILYLRGTETIRALAFPLLLLLFMVPVPGIVNKQITFPLQLLASRLAELALEATGITVLRDGNILEFANLQLSVVEACSGIRSLLSLSFFSLVYAFFCNTGACMRWLLLLSTIPVAIVANASRIVVTGIVGRYSPELSEGVLHAFSGWVIFVVALAILMLTHRLFNHVYGRIQAKA